MREKEKDSWEEREIMTHLMKIHFWYLVYQMQKF